eukprot:6214063-Pleurochrysis_carterae.AAC.2
MTNDSKYAVAKRFTNKGSLAEFLGFKGNLKDIDCTSTSTSCTPFPLRRQAPSCCPTAASQGAKRREGGCC